MSYVPGTSISGTGIIADLIGSETFFIADQILIASTDNTGIRAVDSNVRGFVAGTVFGDYEGIVLGDSTTDTSNSLTIFDTGEVYGLRMGAVKMYGMDASLTNSGRIFSAEGWGVIVSGDGSSTRSEIVNSGTIQSYEVAVQKLASEALYLHNTGTIESATRQAFYSNGTSADTILNAGIMTGGVFLGFGNDYYDGRNGSLNRGGVDGGGGNDTIYGGAGAEQLLGGSENDLMRGGGAKDTIDGGANIDTIDFSDKTQKVSFTLKGASAAIVSVNGISEDTVYNFEYVLGGSAGDSITGDAVANYFRGNGGNDSLSGAGGRDTVRGGAGSDQLDGGEDVDTLDYSDKTVGVVVALAGSTWATVSVGGKAEDKARNFEDLLGGSGADKVAGDAAKNHLAGGGGNDTLEGGAGNDTLLGGEHNDSLVGAAGSDNLKGENGNDVLSGGDSNDTLNGGAGNDTIDGGAGSDLLDYSDRAAISVTLKGSLAAAVKVGGVAEDSVKNVERVSGGSGNDKMVGDASANSFAGGGGNDTLSGGDGNDTLTGGLGTDSLTGGAGNDRFRFVFAAEFAAADVITDFAPGVDRIEIDNASHLGSNGQLNPALYSSVTSGWGDGLDAFIYNRSTGTLYYDAVPGVAYANNPDITILAVLSNKPQNLSAGDIWLI